MLPADVPSRLSQPPQPPQASAGRRFGLSSSALKVIACVTMLVDHIGCYLIPPAQFLTVWYICRIIGRISFPIFAFCIARGCYHTRNQVRRLLLILGLGILCDLASFLFMGYPEGNILLTFSCSILVIYTVQAVKKAMLIAKPLILVLALGSLAAAVVFSWSVNQYLNVDYGFWGIMVPVLAVLPDYKEGEAPAFFRHIDRHWVRLLCLAVGLILQMWGRGFKNNLQVFALLALVPLAFYNGRLGHKPDKKSLKYAFYIFYPAHLVIIWIIGRIIYR